LILFIGKSASPLKRGKVVEALKRKKKRKGPKTDSVKKPCWSRHPQKILLVGGEIYALKGSSILAQKKGSEIQSRHRNSAKKRDWVFGL